MQFLLGKMTEEIN